MNHKLLILLSLLFSLPIFSQTEEDTDVESVPTITIGENFMSRKPVIDTLYIKSGQPIVFLIDIIEYPAQSSHEASIKEEKELISNFEKKSFQIKKIETHTYIIFENKQTLDLSVGSDSYNALAYWGGNMNDTVKTKEGVSFATEFVAKELDTQKESSYIVNARKRKKYITTLKKNKANPFTSKKVMNAFLDKMINPLLEIDEVHAVLFTPHSSNLKKIETFISQDGIDKRIIESIEIHKNGTPDSRKRYDRQGNEKGKSDFIYQDGILTEIIQNSRTAQVYYDGNNIAIFENLGGGDEIKICTLENDLLLLNRYLLMVDHAFIHRNYSSEDKIENSCIVNYFNNEISSKRCRSPKNTLPFLTTEISYEAKQIQRIKKSKLIKKDKTTFEIYHSTSQEEGLKDDFQLWCTIKLNEQKLISSYSFIKRNVKTVISFDYTYY
ncbi:hypothetical protein GCM10022393_14320 [Aquimarina addita]|uniref:DUF4139 domain-containing protein n=1 Tax=Aquimarina addita TaxID=870485 RepID=A0ABP7XG31_9FLAO